MPATVRRPTASLESGQPTDGSIPEIVVTLVRAELAAAKHELLDAVTRSLAGARVGAPAEGSVGAAVAAAVDSSEERLMSTLPAQVQQGLRPMIQGLGAELLASIDAVRRELTDRTKELAAMQDRLHLLYQELATAFVDEREHSEATAETLARVMRRVEELAPPRR